MTIRERKPEDFPAVSALLQEGGLPVSGIEKSRGWIVEEGGLVVGHVALEETQDAAVLRSLVVAPASQSQGLAKQLLDLAELEAGSRTLLLRTKTIGPWVERRGYILATPEMIPASIRTTSEFEGSLCSGYPVYIKAAAR